MNWRFIILCIPLQDGSTVYAITFEAPTPGNVSTVQCQPSVELAVGYPRSQASQTKKEWPGIHCLCKCNYPYKNLGIQWNHLIYLEIVCIIISIHPVLSSKMAASEKAFDLFNSLANLLSNCLSLHLTISTFSEQGG